MSGSATAFSAAAPPGGGGGRLGGLCVATISSFFAFAFAFGFAFALLLGLNLPSINHHIYHISSLQDER
jgi:hypothetical protein